MLRLLIGLILGLLAPLAAQAQQARVRAAEEVLMPSQADSNSPAFWRDGQLYWYNSIGATSLHHGPNQFGPWENDPIEIVDATPFPHWMEATWVDDDGTLFVWYHAEPVGLIADSQMTAPKIGAMVSFDGGNTLLDFGVILESADPIDPSAQNGFFAGGHGDFSVILDRERKYFYFVFGNYGGTEERQGVALARMRFEDRYTPIGKVRKYDAGKWSEPGLGGAVTPIFPVKRGWQNKDPDALWGPSIHWNTYLKQFVILMNHAQGEPAWSQEGIYVSFARDLDHPELWTTPAKILGSDEIGAWSRFYPQVMGLGPAHTDTVAGQVARLYVAGSSRWEIEFVRPESIVEPAIIDPATEPTQEPGTEPPPEAKTPSTEPPLVLPPEPPPEA